MLIDIDASLVGSRTSSSFADAVHIRRETSESISPVYKDTRLSKRDWVVERHYIASVVPHTEISLGTQFGALSQFN